MPPAFNEVRVGGYNKRVLVKTGWQLSVLWAALEAKSMDSRRVSDTSLLPSNKQPNGVSDEKSTRHRDAPLRVWCIRKLLTLPQSCDSVGGGSVLIIRSSHCNRPQYRSPSPAKPPPYLQSVA